MRAGLYLGLGLITMLTRPDQKFLRYFVEEAARGGVLHIAHAPTLLT
jgi:hypothetical protein